MITESTPPSSRRGASRSIREHACAPTPHHNHEDRAPRSLHAAQPRGHRHAGFGSGRPREPRDPESGAAQRRTVRPPGRDLRAAGPALLHGSGAGAQSRDRPVAGLPLPVRVPGGDVGAGGGDQHPPARHLFQQPQADRADAPPRTRAHGGAQRPDHGRGGGSRRQDDRQLRAPEVLKPRAAGRSLRGLHPVRPGRRGDRARHPPAVSGAGDRTAPLLPAAVPDRGRGLAAVAPAGQ